MFHPSIKHGNRVVLLLLNERNKKLIKKPVLGSQPVGMIKKAGKQKQNEKKNLTRKFMTK